MAEGFCGAMMWAPATPGIAASSCRISTRSTPSRRGSPALSRRSTIASGMIVPNSRVRIQRADRAEGIGATPISTFTRGQSLAAQSGDPAPDDRHVHAELGLNETGAGIGFCDQVGGGPVRGRIERQSRGPEHELRWAADGRPGRQSALLGDLVRQCQQPFRIEVEDGFCCRLIAGFRAVPGNDQNIAHAERQRPEKIVLQCETITVATGHLQDRLDAALQQDMRGDEAREMRLGAGAVGDIDGGRKPAQRLRPRQQIGGIGRYRRHHLGSDRETPAGEPGGLFAAIACVCVQRRTAPLTVSAEAGWWRDVNDALQD